MCAQSQFAAAGEVIEVNLQHSVSDRDGLRACTLQKMLLNLDENPKAEGEKISRSCNDFMVGFFLVWGGVVFLAALRLQTGFPL